MDIEKIKVALTSSLSVLNNEVDNIEFEELQKEYIFATGFGPGLTMETAIFL